MERIMKTEVTELLGITYPIIPVSYTHLDVYKRQIICWEDWEIWYFVP